MAQQNPDDFFQSYGASSSSSKLTNRTSSSTAQRRGPPPGPPAAARPSLTSRNTTAVPSTSTSSSSYYGAPTPSTSTAGTTGSSTAAKSIRKPRPQPPQPQRGTNRKPATTNPLGNHTTPAPSATAASSSLYYNSASTPNNNTNNPAFYNANFQQPRAPSSSLSTGNSNPYYSNPTTTNAPSSFPNPANPAAAAASDGYGNPNTTLNLDPTPDSTTTSTTGNNDWFTDFASSATTAPEVSSAPSLQGSMEMHHPPSTATPSIFNPSTFTPVMTAAMNDAQQQQQRQQQFGDIVDEANEPPLLEELGINLEHIWMKTKAVVVPFSNYSQMQLDPSVLVEDADLAGPLVFALGLGFELLLGLEVEFGAIYGFGLAGCVLLTLILNLMCPTGQPISFWTVTSILGYALLPVNLLAGFKLILQNLIGFSSMTRVLAIGTIVWSTMASTRLIEVGCGMSHQRYLIAYPISLLYTAFVLITIF